MSGLRTLKNKISNAFKTHTAPAIFDLEGQENARLGVVYLFSKIEANPNIISVAIEGVLGIVSQGMDNTGKAVVDMVKPVSTTMGSATEKVAWKESMGTGGKGATDSVGAFGTWCWDIVKKLWTEIKTKFGEPKFLVSQMKGLIFGFTRLFAKEVAPFVKGAFDIVKGLAKATPLIVAKIKNWWLTREVTFVEGHPSIMINSLKNAMTVSIFEGLYIAIKGAVDIALTTVTAGAAAIAKIVIAFVEAAVKIIWRMFELFKLSDFCDWCKMAYGMRDAQGAPHKDAKKFADKYREYAMYVPVIAALTLNSGICGDKMRFIQLFVGGDSKNVISQKTFDKGVTAIDDLKPFAGLLLRNMGVSFVIKDGFVKNVVEMAKAEEKPLTTGAKVMKYVNDVLTL